MHVAYLVNQYPKISHSFIRREIAGLEDSDIRVSRYSIRGVEDELVDAADQAEVEKTKAILDISLVSLLSHLIFMAIRRPIAWLRCLKLMLRLWYAADKSLFHYLAYMAEACVLLDWLKDDEIEHVHAHFGTNPTSVAVLCNALGGPTYSFTLHGPEEFDQPIALSLSEKIERAKFVVAVSNFGRSQLYRWCSHQHWSKIHVVHCGLDSDFLNCQTSTSIPDTPQFVCVARLSEQKGHLLLLEAVKQLADDGYKFKVALVGDGELRSELEDLVSKWGIEDLIEFVGWASGATVRKKILESRALVLPSFAEGLPVVIMESLALKRPVISTYIAGIPELVGNNICGWLIPSGSVAALAEAMTKALNAPIEVLETMGQVGAERVAKDHDATIEAQKLVNLFHSHLNPETKLTNFQEVNAGSLNIIAQARAAQNS